MKKTLTFLIAILLTAMAFGQSNAFKYPITIGLAGTANGQITLNGNTSGSVVIRPNVAAGTGTIFQLPNSNGTSGYSLTTNGSGVTSWTDKTTETRNIVADSLNALRNNAVIGSTLYSRLQPDTVQHTANYTVAASDWGKDQHCNKATSIVITLPNNLTAWPTGGVLNFYGHGAGIMVFKKGTSVVFISDKDSIATSRKGQVVSVKKIAANKYFLVGPLTD